jgi:hypothetical protein
LAWAVRYDYYLRQGSKDSTSWGQLNIPGIGQKAVLPSVWLIDEERHQVQASLGRSEETRAWEVVGVFEKSNQENVRQMGQPTGSIRQTEGTDGEMLHGRATYQTRLTDKLRLTTGGAITRYDAVIHGDRVGGTAFSGLAGDAEFRQAIVNANLQYTPSSIWTLTLALRAEKLDQESETLARFAQWFESASSNDLNSFAQSLEARYTGLRNTVMQLRGEWMQGDGELVETRDNVDLGTRATNRATDYDRSLQKYSATVTHYPQPGLSLAAQAYYKWNENDYEHTIDSTSNAPNSGDRYPAIFRNQAFETIDANFRVTYRPAMNIRSVSRIDVQNTSIRTAKVSLAKIESGEIDSVVLSQSITWNPTPKWYLMLAGSRAHDRMWTPAAVVTGAVAGLIPEARNDYWNASLSSGYALDARTDLFFSYSFYDADNTGYELLNYPVVSSGDREHVLRVSAVRRLTDSVIVSMLYQYADHDDLAAAGFRDFRGHLLYGKMQVRF